MIKYRQTVFGNGEDGSEPGNCFATCVAAILEYPLEEIPNFVDSDNWFEDVNNFLRPHGYSLVIYDLEHKENFHQHAGYAIAAGMGPRGYKHCCVWKHKALVMDPHPSDDFLETIDKLYFFASLNPQDR